MHNWEILTNLRDFIDQNKTVSYRKDIPVNLMEVLLQIQVYILYVFRAGSLLEHKSYNYDKVVLVTQKCRLVLSVIHDTIIRKCMAYFIVYKIEPTLVFFLRF